MFKTDNTKIGKHLSNLIKNSKYKNDRQFGIAYLRLRDNDANPAPDDIQKMQNRICQIKKGSKGIQIEDLPIFSELLEVSIEDILSAGTALAPALNRKSNYSIAYSNDPAEWEAYIKRKDKLILNPDEYNKTALIMLLKPVIILSLNTLQIKVIYGLLEMIKKNTILDLVQGLPLKDEKLASLIL